MKKIYFLHPAVHNLGEMLEYLGLTNKLENINDWEWNRENPDILLVSEHIYLNEIIYKQFCKYLSDEHSIKIYIEGECISPDMNLFDYAIVFDRKLLDNDRIIRNPILIFHSKSIIYDQNNIVNPNDAEGLLANRKFCCFLYSNPNAHPMRDKLFYEISKYKKVDSLGHHLKNVEKEPITTSNDWHIQSIEIKENYKFSIACENATYEGYTSEKLLSSLQAHTVPIYWGNPYVSEEFNDKAFIDCSKYSDFESLISRIKQIDEDDELWRSIVAQPWMTPEQKENCKIENRKYFKFWNNIFTQSIESLHRVPSGTYPSRYRYFFKHNSIKSSLKVKIKTLIGRY